MFNSLLWSRVKLQMFKLSILIVQAFGRQPVPPAEAEPETEKNAPDPQLFPYLARRLADTRAPPGADEYLAAATVLAMKYGPAVLDQVTCLCYWAPIFPPNRDRDFLIGIEIHFIR